MKTTHAIIALSVLLSSGAFAAPAKAVKTDAAQASSDKASLPQTPAGAHKKSHIQRHKKK